MSRRIAKSELTKCKEKDKVTSTQCEGSKTSLSPIKSVGRGKDADKKNSSSCPIIVAIDLSNSCFFVSLCLPRVGGVPDLNP